MPGRGRPKGYPKTGGRQKNTPNRVTVEIREAAKGLLEDPAYVQSLQVRLREGTAGAVESLLYHYAYGKPKETIEHSTPMVPVLIDLLKPGEGLKLSDDE
jgi:hypothetical protein